MYIDSVDILTTRASIFLDSVDILAAWVCIFFDRVDILPTKVDIWATGASIHRSTMSTC